MSESSSPFSLARRRIRPTLSISPVSNSATPTTVDSHRSITTPHRPGLKWIPLVLILLLAFLPNLRQSPTIDDPATDLPDTWNIHRSSARLIRAFVPTAIHRSPLILLLPNSDIRGSVRMIQLQLDTHSVAESITKRRIEAHRTGETSDSEDSSRSQTVVYDGDRHCVPMADWQTTFHPTCNSIHEIDPPHLLSHQAFQLVSSKGFWRNAWRINATNSDPPPNDHPIEYIVLKSLKYHHPPNDETMELSRVDAVSLDRLSHARFTIRIYSYCATSSLQEYAGGNLQSVLHSLTSVEKLQMAMRVAEAVEEVHSLDGGGTLIHNDINMDNVLVGRRGGGVVPLLNDYNIAVFGRREVGTGGLCPFRGRFANPQWMSPEQQERPGEELSTGYLNEKIDVYALGNILYKVAVGTSPWKADYKTKKITPELKHKIARAKLRGAKPKVPHSIRNTNDSSIRAILNAMDWCYRNDPLLRPSAKVVAMGLRVALEEVEGGGNGTGGVSWLDRHVNAEYDHDS